jgi:tetratricopeptide (TPR) repeat protein
MRMSAILSAVFLILCLQSQAQNVLPFQQNAVTADNEDQMAQQFFQARNYEKAAELYNRIYSRKPGYYTYTYYFYCLVEIRAYDDARKLIRQQQKNDPNSLKYLVDQGYVFYREGNADKSRKLYEEAVKKLPPDPSQVYDLASAFYSKGEYEFVIRTYLKGRQMLPENYAFGFELAGVYERTGNYEGAFGEYFYMLALNKSFEATVKDRLQMLLASDDDNSKNELFRKTLLQKTQKEPDKECYSELLLWYSIQQKDFELAFIQARALDRRFRADGQGIMELAAMALSNNDFKVADDAYAYVVSKGKELPFYAEARRQLLHTRYLGMASMPDPQKKQMETLARDISEELVGWEGDPEASLLAVDLAQLLTFRLGKPGEAIDLLEKVADWNGMGGKDLAEVKLELADIHLFTGDLWTASVLYQQVYQDFKNETTGQEAKFRNARLSYFMGEFDWASAQLNILRGATSKFISNDAMALYLLISGNYDPDSNTVALGMYSRAELADYRGQEIMALTVLDSIPATFPQHPILDRVVFRKATIYQKTGDYHAADSLFAIVVRNRPRDLITEEALMKRAEIHEKNMNDKTGAMEFYQQLLNDFPGSVFTDEARKRFRKLRGDNLK